MTSRAQPALVSQSDPRPVLTNITQDGFEVFYPDEKLRTNYVWFFEIADNVTGPWRLPDRQRPDDSNIVIHLGGARFIRMHGNPN